MVIYIHFDDKNTMQSSFKAFLRQIFSCTNRHDDCNHKKFGIRHKMVAPK